MRPAYTLGGTGGGVAHNMDELMDITARGLKMSLIHQVLLEQSVAGWKEIEYEVIRDNADNCIIVCNMENIDPVGIHTGDSIVVAPSQTLTDREYQMLRTSALKIIRALDIRGGCNIQYALDPDSYDYVVIEVNPRVSPFVRAREQGHGLPHRAVSRPRSPSATIWTKSKTTSPAKRTPASNRPLTMSSPKCRAGLLINSRARTGFWERR